MHSSGMYTARLLTVSQPALRRGCVCLGGGVYPGGVFARGEGVSAKGGGCLPRGGVCQEMSTQGGWIPACTEADPPWTDRHL